MILTRLQVLIVTFPTIHIIVNQANPTVFVIAFGASHMVTATDFRPRNLAFRAQFRLFPNASLRSLVVLL